MSRPPSPRSPRRRSPAIANSTCGASPLIMLGLLILSLAAVTLYTHTNHIMQNYQDSQTFRFESTTYRSSLKRKTHKRIHRTKDGKEVVEIVEDSDDKRGAVDTKESDSEKHETKKETESKQDAPENPKEPTAAKKPKQSSLRANTDNEKNVDTHDEDSSTTWPAPHLTKESTVILVLSARKHVELRQVIRETWGSGHDNVYFVIGQYCPVNQAKRKDLLECEEYPHNDKSHHDEWYEKRMKLETSLLREEQEHYRDMLWTPSPESYRGLPHKLKEGYSWIVNNLPNAKWIVKADDDTVVRVGSLGTYLETTIDARKPTVVGKLEYEGIVYKDGRWKELKYPHDKYPTFPLGSCGHAVSRPVAQYIASNKASLVEYQGEDTSVGIWMHEAPMQVEFLYASSFENDGKCENPNNLIIGHDLSIEKIRECHEIGDEVQPIVVKQF